MATPALKSNVGDQKVNKSCLFGANEIICPSGSLFGITQQSIADAKYDRWIDFSIRTSHP